MREVAELYETLHRVFWESVPRHGDDNRSDAKYSTLKLGEANLCRYVSKARCVIFARVLGLCFVKHCTTRSIPKFYVTEWIDMFIVTFVVDSSLRLALMQMLLQNSPVSMHSLYE